ncbi:5-formyltetrahydrofolate cyclo-ligase [Limihaloglobus sulfuriphilus]|nr:5-formyltetrahydrofolate cyclo-ligase [Limihaloglobus sulfuriphilus]
MRKAVEERLKCLDGFDILKASLDISRRFFDLEEYRGARSIMIYSSIHGEVDTELIMDMSWRLNKNIIYPAICWERRELVPVKIDSAKELRPGRWGLLEPVNMEPYPLEEIDVVVAPGLAFDLCGNRLGRGGGYYDRFLSRKHDADVVALAFSCQLQRYVPTDENDKMVDILITENMTAHCAKLYN